MVYHGTFAPFNEFRKDRINRNYSSRFAEGFYFTEIKENASFYKENSDASASGDQRTILSVYLSMQNPLEVHSASQYREVVHKERENPKRGVVERYKLLSKTDSEILSMLGYDGVIFYFHGKMNEIIAFSPNQIKSATGNTGAFSSQSDNIYE